MNVILSGVARKLASSGFGVFALDYPGFGLSDGLHGYIPSFENLVNDVIEHFSKIKGKCNFPLFQIMQYLYNSYVKMFPLSHSLWCHLVLLFVKMFWLL